MPKVTSSASRVSTSVAWTWGTKEGVNGFWVENNSKHNTHSIFIPVTGYVDGTETIGSDDCYYWTSTATNATNGYATYLYASKGYSPALKTGVRRYAGLVIRPVYESNTTLGGKDYLIRTDSVSHTDATHPTTLYGTMLGMTSGDTAPTEGFVIGTAKGVTTTDATLTLSQTAEGNGIYAQTLTDEQMKTLSVGQTYYVRAYVTLGSETRYGDAVTMTGNTFLTDCATWTLGNKGTFYGSVKAAKADGLEVGFYYSDNAKMTNAKSVTAAFLTTGNTDVFTASIDTVHLQTYYVQAYTKLNGTVYTTNIISFGAHTVDLGLPSGVQWTDMNLGTNSERQTGDKYKWSELTPNTENFTTSQDEAIGGMTSDVAHRRLGTKYRMPSWDNLQELVNPKYTTWTWEVNGYRVTSKTNGSDRNGFLLPNGKVARTKDKVGSQDTLAAYVVVAPQTGSVPMELTYHLYDTKSEKDTTIVKTVTFSNGIDATAYSITSKLPCRAFTTAFTVSVQWDFDKPATLYGSTNLPMQHYGFLLGNNKDLSMTSYSKIFKDLTPSDNLSFSQASAVASVDQNVYYYRAYANDGKNTFLGKIKKFGMNRELINLGTSVRWSSINLGATTKEDKGNLYAWGELNAKDDDSQSNYEYYKDGKYVNIGANIAGDPRYDAVTKLWRGCWRMPTQAEMVELSMLNKEWTTVEGQQGWLFKNKNGNADSTMFLPAYKGTEGVYWTGNLNTYYSGTYAYDAYIYTNNYSAGSGNYNRREYARAIRPVFDSNIETEKKQNLFISTDSISYDDNHTTTTLHGTLRGMDNLVTDITEGFVVGKDSLTTADSSPIANVSATASDNGPYTGKLSSDDQKKLLLGTNYFSRAYLTFDGNTYYRNAVPFTPYAIATDSTNWQVGKTEARLCGTAKGILDATTQNLGTGFVIGDKEDVKLGDTGATDLAQTTATNGVYKGSLSDLEGKQYYYRAYMKQKQSDDSYNYIYGEPKMFGLEMVDLGLPSGTHWANINLGAQSPIDNGDAYAFAKTVPNVSETVTNTGADISGTTFDAAQVNWKSVWRMPTKDEAQELLDNCTAERTTWHGKLGWKLTSKLNGKSIFLSIGAYSSSELAYRTSYGNTGSNNSNSTPYDISDYYYTSHNNKPYLASHNKYSLLPIRPVARWNRLLGTEKTPVLFSTDSVTWKVGDSSASLYGYLFGLRYDSKATAAGFYYSPSHITKKTLSTDTKLTMPTVGTEAVPSLSYHSDATDLSADKVYYYRAYVTYDGTTYLGEEREFGRRSVDLGLPSKTRWSNINVGAASPDSKGSTFAWGETTSKSIYARDNYTTASLPRHIDGSSYDAAHTTWGGLWQMPTRKDWRELLKYCTLKDTLCYGQPAYKVIGPSGDSIFITKTALWSATMTTDVDINTDKAYAANTVNNALSLAAIARYQGNAIRPVEHYNNTLGDKTQIEVKTDSTNWAVGKSNVTLAGSVLNMPSTLSPTYGFAVSYNPDPKADNTDDKSLKLITATAATNGDGYRATFTYDKDTTVYYRFYAQLGSSYYYGPVRSFGLEIVDFGDGVAWASLNLGAQCASDLGDRYSWGATKSQSTFTETAYPHYSNGTYANIGANLNGTNYDAAATLWQGKWRMPTQQEIQNLISKCTWTVDTVDDVPGYRVTAKNKKSIFLPAGGYQENSFYTDMETKAYYWSASLLEGSKAYALSVSAAADGKTVSPTLPTDGMTRYLGLFIRPVMTATGGTTAGGGITGGHNQGTSTDISDEGNGSGNAGTGNTGGTIGD